MTGVQSIDWLAVGPPVWLAATAVVVLLLDVAPAGVTRPRFLPATLSLVGVTVAALTAAVAAVPGADLPRGTFCAMGVAAGPGRCSFVVDPLTLVVWGVVLGGTAAVVLIGTAAAHDGRTPQGEWHFLLLSSAAGALSLAASRDLITLVVSLEVVSLPAFALVGLRRGDPRAAEAAVKFFLVSVIATAVTLMGISLVYGAAGSVYLADVAAATDAAVGSMSGPAPELRTVLAVGAVLAVVGLAFKVAAVPFHMWVPDTYVGAPVAVAAYLSVVSKAAGFVGLLLVLHLGLGSLAPVWSPVMAVLAAATMTGGNVLALQQQHAVRLLAWSSVAQAGYVLVPFGAVAAGGGGAVLSGPLGTAFGYLAVYAVLNLSAFAVVAAVATRRPTQHLTEYRGLVREHPLEGWALAFALVALAGLPPGVIGLLAKVLVLDAAAGTTTWLAVVMALNVAVGLVYYLRWARELFLTPSPVGPPTSSAAGPTAPAVRSAALAAAVGTSSRTVPLRGVRVAVATTFAAGVVLSVLPGSLLDRILS